MYIVNLTVVVRPEGGGEHGTAAGVEEQLRQLAEQLAVHHYEVIGATVTRTALGLDEEDAAALATAWPPVPR